MTTQNITIGTKLNLIGYAKDIGSGEGEPCDDGRFQVFTTKHISLTGAPQLETHQGIVGPDAYSTITIRY